MKLITSLNLNKIEQLITPFVAIAGYKSWDRRFQIFNQQLKNNPLLEQYFIQRYPIELCFLEIWERKKKHRKFSNKINNIHQNDLFSLMALSTQLYDHLSIKGKKRLQGMFRDALKSDQGFVPLYHELLTICHLNNRGYDIEAHDYECGGGYDFLAKGNGIEFEIDAKTVSADVGRKIHNKDVYMFAEYFYKEIKPILNNLDSGYFIDIEFSDRMDKSPDYQINLSKIIKEMLFKPSTYCDDSVEIKLKSFDINTSPFNIESKLKDNENIFPLARKYISQFTEKENEEIILQWRPGISSVIVMLSSKKPNKLAESIYKELKKSIKNQFSETRPAMIHVLMTDITPDQLQSISTSDHDGGISAFKAISNRLFDSGSRTHLHSIAFSSKPEFNIHTNDIGETHYNSPTPTYYFTNDKNSHKDDERLRLFET